MGKLDHGVARRPGRRSKPYANRAARIRFRRAITLIIMTIAVPGSAQLMCGNRRVGRIAVRIWIGCWALVAVGVCLSLFSRRSLFSLVTDPGFLLIGLLVVFALAIMWVGLLIDAWRLGMPRSLRRGQRLTVTAFNAALCLALAVVVGFAAHLVLVQRHFLGSVFASDTVSKPSDGRYNVLLMGADSGPGRDGWRPDSLTVASIDEETGRTVLIGIPRNLKNVPFPEGSAMAEHWPHGFNCAECEINAINTWVTDHKQQFANSEKLGEKATEQAVEQVTGLKINYRISVNMAGFSKLVDAVGGVTVNVRERTAIGGVGSPVRGYIPSGTQRLDGEEALWFARSRVQTDDWHRMGRQKCLLHSMLEQLSPKTVLLHAEKIADSSASLLTTNVPQQDLDLFMDLALKAKDQKLSVVSLIPPKVDTSAPDFDKIHQLVTESVAKAEGRKVNRGGIESAKLPPVEAPTAEDLSQDGRDADNTNDLDSAC